MPCGGKARFVLLYGSQKGQAQSIAEGLCDVAEEHGLVAELSCLDTNEKVAGPHVSTSSSMENRHDTNTFLTPL